MAGEGNCDSCASRIQPVSTASENQMKWLIDCRERLSVLRQWFRHCDESANDGGREEPVAYEIAESIAWILRV